ncbi:MAG: hypothetical protein FWF15_10805 [Oscillospiraceae bacterium]|nr:hypothetical protein [Oscillospiraceae bacterium]
MKKVVSILMAVFLLTILFISCNDNNAGKSDDTEKADETKQIDDIAALFEKDNLPDNINFNGKTVTILYREEEIKEFYMDQQTGDIVEDAVYIANKNVEERLNIEIKTVTQLGNLTADRITFISTIVNSVLSGDDEFQIVAALTYTMPELIQKNMIIDLLKVPNISFEKPWWVQALVDYGTIGDQMFLASGDVSLSLIKKTFCLYFNQNLLNNLQLASPYEMVYNKTWTFDNFKALMKGVYIDLNGDGAEDFDDQYGFHTCDRNHMNLFIGAFDLQVTSKDEDGYPTLVFGNEKVVTAIQTLCDFFYNTEGVAFNNLSDAGNDLNKHTAIRNMFTSGRLLFVSAEFNNVEFYRDMNDVYGVLPLPKWDEKQADYYTLARNVYSSFAIPKTCRDLNMAGTVLEAIASENYRTLSPVYFEQALKVKYSNDSDAAQMYDIIKNGLKFNFGYTYHLIVGITDHFTEAVHGNNPNWASTFDAQRNAAEKRINDFVKLVIENKE